jgi:hypothetical protein
MSKPWLTTFTAGDYAGVRAMGDDYLAKFPRRIAQ